MQTLSACDCPAVLLKDNVLYALAIHSKGRWESLPAFQELQARSGVLNAFGFEKQQGARCVFEASTRNPALRPLQERPDWRFSVVLCYSTRGLFSVYVSGYRTQSIVKEFFFV